MAKLAFSASDVPYFAKFVPRRSTVLKHMPFANSSGTGDRVMAILMILGGILGGLVVAGGLLVAGFMLSFGSSPSRGDVVFATLLGLSVALCGVVLGVLTYRYAGVRSGIAVGEDHLEISYQAFKKKVVVPRSAVRAVDIDDAPTHLFTANARFPIAGDLPEGVFADALDNHPAAPWDDLDPERRPTPWEFPRRPRPNGGPDAGPDGYAHDDPESPGWASSGHAAVFRMFAGREAHLWSGQGSSLPFLRCGPGDVPNLAVLFNTPQFAPRPPWWFDLLPGNSRIARFRGGREVRGFLMKMRHPSAAAGAFEPWGVVRPITADDVLAEGLLIAKPLKGVRAVVYAGLILTPMVISLVSRLLR
jgi:hypothetical protein